MLFVNTAEDDVPDAGEQEGLPADQVHHALKYGAPSSESLRFFKNFVVSYDSRLRNPRWVQEHITAQQTQGDGNRQASSMRSAPRSSWGRPPICMCWTGIMAYR